MKKDFVVHIGFPKTGSTFLQKKIFSKLHDVNLIGQPLRSTNKLIDNFILKITDLEDLEYNNYDINKDFEFLSRGKKKIIISEETFATGSSHSGNVCRLKICQRLFNLYNNFTIFIVVRNPVDLLKSVYKQKIKFDDQFSLSINDWIELEKKKIGIQTSIFDIYDQAQLIKYYQSIFENVLIFNYEEFENTPIEFFNKIKISSPCFNSLDFKNISNDFVNKSYNPVIYKLKRYIDIIPFTKFLYKFKMLKNIVKILNKTCGDLDLSSKNLQFINNKLKLDFETT